MKFTQLTSILLLITLYSCSTSKLPTALKLSDTDKVNMVRAFQWQEKNPNTKDPRDWTHGAYYTGVVKAHQATGDKVYLDGLMDMSKRNNWDTYTRPFHADDVAISYSYLYLSQLNQPGVDLAATDKFLDVHFGPSDWRDGKGAKKEQSQLWWWCDALFMAPPVYTKRAKMLNDTKYLDMMHEYYMQTYNLLYDKGEKLFARDTRFVIKKDTSDRYEPNGKKILWSRGNGWVFAGLALILEDMPKNYKHRPFYENLFKEMAATIKSHQPQDGLWRVSLLDPNSWNHGEVSGSGFFTYAFAWGVNNGLLNKSEYLPSIEKSWTGLKACQKETGMIGWVQNIGASPEPATTDSWQNYGTGAYLLAASELLKLN
jgi:unsaturated rhamnogalacturonyl hydrolase